MLGGGKRAKIPCDIIDKGGKEGPWGVLCIKSLGGIVVELKSEFPMYSKTRGQEGVYDEISIVANNSIRFDHG